MGGLEYHNLSLVVPVIGSITKFSIVVLCKTFLSHVLLRQPVYDNMGVKLQVNND